MEDIRHWRNFLRVAQHGSLSAVSNDLGIAQPILSRQIARLELIYDVKLFERHGRGMRLTAAGALLRRRAEELLRQISLIPDELSAGVDQPSGFVSVALPPSLTTLLSAPLFREVAARYPRVRLTVREMTLASLRQSLVSNEVAFGIGSIPLTDPEFEVEPILQEPMFVVGPRSWRPPSRGMTWRGVADLPLILPPRPNSIRIIVENMMERIGRVPNVLHETDFAPAFECIASGYGFGVIPSCALANPALGTRVRSARIKDSHIRWALIGLKSRASTSAATAVRTTVLEVITTVARRSSLWNPIVLSKP